MLTTAAVVFAALSLQGAPVPAQVSVPAAGAPAAFAVPADEIRPGVSARDPFAPALYVRDAIDPSCAEAATDDVACVQLETLSLRAIVTATATPRAMFEDKAGRSHLVRVGDVVSGMRVVGVRRGVVVLERRLLNAFGFTSKSEVLVRLP